MEHVPLLDDEPNDAELFRTAPSELVLDGFGAVFREQFEYTKDANAFSASTVEARRRRASSIAEKAPLASVHGSMSSAPAAPASVHGTIAPHAVGFAAVGPKFSEHELSDVVFCATTPSTSADGFISHTWMDSAFQKYLALCSYSNLSRAVAFSWLLWLILVMALLAVYGPTGMGGITWLKTLFLLIPASGFFAAFFFATSILGGEHWWLDKLCIHQTRASWKLAGVKQLPMFCNKSESLIILWSEGYFSRLWCCCELATFSANHKLSSIKLQPLWLAPWVLSTILVDVGCSFIVAYLLEEYFAYFIETIGTWGPVPALVVAFCGYAPAIVPNLISFRAKARAHKSLLNQLENFQLKACQCAVEADRDHVQMHITKLWGTVEAFDAVVCKEFHDIVVSNVGDTSHMPLYLSVLPFLPLFWSAAADIFGCDGGPCAEVAPEEGLDAPWKLVVTIFFEWAICMAWAPLIYPTMFLALSYTEQLESLALRNVAGAVAIFLPYVFYLGLLGGFGSTLCAMGMIVGGWWTVFALVWAAFVLAVQCYFFYEEFNAAVTWVATKAKWITTKLGLS